MKLLSIALLLVTNQLFAGSLEEELNLILRRNDTTMLEEFRTKNPEISNSQIANFALNTKSCPSSIMKNLFQEEVSGNNLVPKLLDTCSSGTLESGVLMKALKSPEGENSFNSKTKFGVYSVQNMIERGLDEEAKFIVASLNPTFSSEANILGHALLTAINSGNNHLVEFIFEQGKVDANFVGKLNDREMSVVEAARNRPSIIALLIQNGLELNIDNFDIIIDFLSNNEVEFSPEVTKQLLSSLKFLQYRMKRIGETLSGRTGIHNDLTTASENRDKYFSYSSKQDQIDSIIENLSESK